MKQKLLLFVLLFIFGFTTFANQIDENTAKIVGQNFLTKKTNSLKLKNATNFQLVFKSNSENGNQFSLIQPTTFFYVFNVNNSGFVIVSGDDKVTPILGYSDQGVFDPNNIPQNVAKWFEGYKKEIISIIEQNIQPTNEIKSEWQSLISGNGNNSSSKTLLSINPLIQTMWNQSPYYNSSCPSESVTGCVATAMAQIMKYWNYPATGTGFHSYNHSTYGTLSANFGSTSYQWSSMPNYINSSNNAVATLMYQVGVSVDMNYSPQSSGAYVISAQSPVTNCAEYALKTYFGYKNSLQGVQRSNYTQTQWLNLLEQELDASRPIIYAGFGDGGGHCFVADGYDNNDYIHFNWGWGGQADGYFEINALNPNDLGTGGGSGGYNSGQQAIIGIEPSVGNQTYDMRLYSSITTNPNPINYNSGFSVTVDVANYGSSATNNFSGDYTAAIFNSSNQFVSYIETKTGNSLPFNSHNVSPLVFTTSSLPALTPGNYSIGILYKAEGATQWTAFAKGNYQNFISIEVQGNNTNTLKLYAAIVTTPNIIVQNQTFDVTFDIANFGSSTFTGDVSVDIHRSDGTWIRELAIKNGLSMPSNTHFSNGLTYTIMGGISDEPGTYQLFVWDKPDISGWEFLGNGTFLNPITIQVVAPSLNPDSYEDNNTVEQSYALPLNFTENNAETNTTGSNCHIISDNDFYKIVLPSGYNYTITPRLHDSYNSGNGNTYTLDALFSYSTDGNTWSDSFDDVISGNITLNGGETVYFHVAPYFAGETGTYLLDMLLTRSSTLGISENQISDDFEIYPNPAKDFVILDFNKFRGELIQINILNVQGQNILTLNTNNQSKTFNIPLSNFSNGIYFLQLLTESGILTKKIIVSK